MGQHISSSRNNVDTDDDGDDPIANQQQLQQEAQEHVTQQQQPSSSSYFLMFGGPPVTTTSPSAGLAESVLFLQRRLQQQQQASLNVTPPEFRPTEILKNDLNLLKRTLKLVPLDINTNNNNNNSHHIDYNSITRYTLQFEFDTRVDCDIFIHFVALERRDASSPNHLKIKPTRFSISVPVQRFTAGIGQIYKLPQECGGIDLSELSDADLHYDERVDPFKYPIIIEMRSVVPFIGNNSSNSSSSSSSITGDNDISELQQQYNYNGDNNNMLKCQFTYATINQNSDGSYGTKVLKQKIQVGDKVYELAEIYGFDGVENATTMGSHVVNMESSPSHTSDDALCVICMTDLADTSLIPCRHMCLCYECAGTLRVQTNKCPICRAKISSMIQIPQINEEGDSGDDRSDVV